MSSGRPRRADSHRRLDRRQDPALPDLTTTSATHVRYVILLMTLAQVLSVATRDNPRIGPSQPVDQLPDIGNLHVSYGAINSTRQCRLLMLAQGCCVQQVRQRQRAEPQQHANFGELMRMYARRLRLVPWEVTPSGGGMRRPAPSCRSSTCCRRR